MSERMLRFGINSSIKVVNTQSLSYHSIASSSVNRAEHEFNTSPTPAMTTMMVVMNGDSNLPTTDASIGNSSGITLQLTSPSINSVQSGSSGGINGNNGQVDGANPSNPIFTCICFNQYAPIVYLSIRNEIFFYDLLNQSVIGKITIDKKETVKHLLVVSKGTPQRYLVCITDTGMVYLWETDTYTLITILPPLKQFDTRVITTKTLSPVRGLLFYSKSNSKDIVVIDFQAKGSAPFKLKGHKKPISSLAHHPTKPILASVSNDGSLKLWETRSAIQASAFSFEDFVSYENSRNIEHSTNYFLAFESTTGKYMVMTGSSGLTLVYGDISSSTPQDIIANGFVCKGNIILNLVHHPQLPVFFVISINSATGLEEVSSWEVSYQTKSIVPSILLPPIFVPSLDGILDYVPEYSKPLSLPHISATNIIFHPYRNLMTFQWELNGSFPSLAAIRHINQYIYSISPYDKLQQSLPLTTTVPLPLGFFFTPEHTFNYPADIAYFDGSYVRVYVPLNGVSKKLIIAPSISPTSDELCRAKSFSYCPEHQLVTLIYDSYSISTQTLLSKYLIVDVQGTVSQQGDGIDAVLIGSSHILILGLGGNIAKVATINGQQGVSAFKNHQLSPKINSVFKTPINDGKVVQYYSAEKNCILFSKNINTSDKDNYTVDTQLQLYLYKNERIIKIEWQTDYKLNQNICAIMTDKRIMITNSKMEIINQILVPPTHRDSQCYFGSIFWVEWTLLYTTPTHLMYLTLQNNIAPRPVSSLSVAPILISTVLPDRIIYAYQGVSIGARSTTSDSQPSSPIQSQTSTSSMGPPAPTNNNNYINNQTFIHCLSIGLLECLIVGLLSVPPWLAYDKKTTATYLQNMVSKFDYTRMSRFSLDKLREKGFADLTYSLANNMHTCQNRFTSLEKFRLAWTSKQYEDAHRHLIDEYNKQMTSSKLLSTNDQPYMGSPDGPLFIPTNTLHASSPISSVLNGSTNAAITASMDRRSLGRVKELMRDFGRECMNAGYYQLARDCFIKLNEHIYLLEIAMTLNDLETIKQIKRDAESRSDIVLVGACERFLNKKTNGENKINPPVIKILPWTPTPAINVGIKVGSEYLTPINLNNIHRYFPITGVFSNASSSHGGQRHKLRAPDEKWPPEDYKHAVALSPPRTLMSLVSNRLSTKAHISSTHTLRRSPSSENVVALNGGPSKGKQDYNMDYDFDSDSESGADADIDSDTEEDLKLVTKNIEDHMKVLADTQSIGDDDSSTMTDDHSINESTPLSSTPTTTTI